jgi:hypothetical protein
MWNLLREALRRNDLTKNREWRERIDRYHFIERLAAVLEAFCPAAREAKKRRALLDRWRRQIDAARHLVNGRGRVVVLIAGRSGKIPR